MFVRNRLFAAFSILFASGCAAVNAPEGGPRDEKKPALVSTTPVNGATNFSGKIITLKFDENIRPKDLNKELIITPNTGITYSVKTDRQNLILEFNKPFEENTTYFLNFRNGIEDITEGNKAPETVIAFSTGSFLDTASVTGTVTDYLTQLPENDITVALYPESDTSNIRDHKPYYFTRTNADGSFRMQNLKTGNYRIFAHSDKNANEIYDQESEKIAYLAQPVTINPNLDSVVLKTVRLDSKKPFVLSTEQFLDLNILVYSEGIEKITFRTLEPKPVEKKQLAFINETGKRVTIYSENGKLPERLLAISTDSAGNAGQDTVKFALKNKASLANILTFAPDKAELQEGQLNQVKITFPVPVQITGKSPFTIKEDTIRNIVPAYPKDYNLNENKTELILNYQPNAKKLVELTIDSTQVSSLSGKPFSKQTIHFTLSRKATTGSITGTVKTTYKNYTVELLDEKNSVKRSDKNLRKLNYPDLAPGNYFIRVKIDENNDGKWVLGDKKLKTMPEKLYRYPKSITVRANWEIENIDLIF